MEANYILGGGWGDHISWGNTDFSNVNLNKDTIEVYGHKPNKPRVGDTMIAEFKKSFIKFEFVSVEYPGDPQDMFFGKVKAIAQEMKVV